MTDQQIIDMYNEMEKMFGTLPNPEHEPIRFAYYVKLYRFCKERSNENT